MELTHGSNGAAKDLPKQAQKAMASAAALSAAEGVVLEATTQTKDAPPAAATDTVPAQGPNMAEKTVAAILGEIAWLMSQSPAHKHLFLADLEWLVMPPVLLKQFKIYYGKDRPVAVALWAQVSEEVEKRLEAGDMRLRPQDWRSGDRNWLLGVILPFNVDQGKIVSVVVADLSANIFGGATPSIFGANRLDPQQGPTLQTKQAKSEGIN